MEFGQWRQENNPYWPIDNVPEDDERAKNELAFDYFDAHRPGQPKKEIGEYVREQGFDVPLIQSKKEWQTAFDAGQAMIRSEMPQDYDGLSGLLSSFRYKPDYYEPDRQDESYYARFGRIVIEGLRDGYIPPIEYMSGMRGYSNWDRTQKELLERAKWFGVEIELLNPGVSLWRYIPGDNVTIFADPHIAGRYHFGVSQHDKQYGGQGSIGDYQYEIGEYDTPKQFRKHDNMFVPRDFIETYEAIRNLPRFDNTDCPVMELQQDFEGKIHFLQYLKSGQKQQLIEPFLIEATEDAVRTINVRGITAPEGKTMRLFLTPSKLMPQMHGEGVFFSLTRPHGIEQQLAAQAAGFVLHEAYISFKDNHFSSAPMFRPPLAAGFDGLQGTKEHMYKKLNDLHEKAMRHTFNYDEAQFVDIHVTANGCEAVIESDWEVNAIPYSDLQ